MDYLLMLNGLAFLVIFPICVMLSRMNKQSEHWIWLGLFGILHGTDAVVSILIPCLPASDISPYIRMSCQEASALCLLEFARRSYYKLGYSQVPAWIFIPLIAAAGVCWIVFPSIAMWILGLPAYFFAAWVFWIARTSGRFPPFQCIAGAYAMAAYGVLVFLTPTSFFFFSKEPIILGVLSFNAREWQLALRFVCGLVLAITLWAMCWHRYSKDLPSMVREKTRIYEKATAWLVVLILAASWTGTRWVQKLQENHQKRDLLERTRQAGVMMDFYRINRINWENPDHNSQDYILLQNWLTTLVSIVPQSHGASITTLRNGRAYWLAFSTSTNPPSNFNSPYAMALKKALITSGASVSDPVSDGKNFWIVGTYSLLGKAPGEKIALHLDMPIEKFQKMVYLARLPVLLLTIGLCLTVVGIMAFWTRLRMFSLTQNMELFRVQRQEAAISRLANSAATSSVDFNQASREIIQLAAEALDVARVSLWMADKNWNSAENRACYDKQQEMNERMPPWLAKDSPMLFDQLSNGNAVESSNTRLNPIMAEFYETRLEHRGIGAALYFPFCFERRNYGFLAIEHVGKPRPWMKDERQFAWDIINAIVNAMSRRRRNEIEEALAASERQFREFVEVLPQIAFETNMDGLFTMVNQAAYELTGYTPEDVKKGLSIFNVCPPSTHLRVRHNLRQIASGIPSNGEEYPLTRKDGSIFFGLIYTTLYVRNDNKGSGFRGIVVDISQRKKTEEALLESERRLTQIINFLPDPTLIIDKDKKVVYWNRAMELMTGEKSETMIGRSDYSMFFYGEHRPLLIDLLFDQPKGIESRYITLQHDGDSLVGEASLPSVGSRPAIVLWGVARALYDTEGNLVGAIESVRDVTARRKAEDQLRETHAQLARNYESLVTLLRQQEVNIDLARQVLNLINSKPQRHIPLSRDLELCVTSFYIPCHAAGGDHYFVHTLKKTHNHTARTILSLKDQSGHEVGCILRSIVTDLAHNALLRRRHGNTLDNVFTHLNNIICVSNLFNNDDFFTSINVDINHETLEMSFLSTGHPPCLLIRGEEVTPLPKPQAIGCNLPIGFMSGRQFAKGTIQLQPHDRLLFYTDGLLEIPRWSGGCPMEPTELADRVRFLAAEYPDCSVSALIAKLLNQLIPEGDIEKIAKSDDVALLACEIEQTDSPYETVLHPESAEQLSDMIKELSDTLQQEWNQYGIENPEYRLRLVLEETIINAWKHGNRADPSKTISIKRRYGNDAIIEITDQGRGFAFEEIQNPTITANRIKNSGRGIFLTRLVSNQVSWRDNGRTIVICFQSQPYPKLQPSKREGHEHNFSMDLWGDY